MRVWVDGAVVEASEARVSVYDHGFTTGDGVFETVKVVSGQAFALTRHLRRLARSARGLGLPEPDADRVRRGVHELLESNSRDQTGAGTGDWRLRITFTAGPAPLGSQRGDSGPTLVLAAAPLPPAEESCDVSIVPWSRNEYGALAGVKSTSYADNVLALAHAHRHGAGEAVFANTAGNLCEGTGSNVFLVRGGELVTPPLAAGCLAGVTRELVLEWFGAAQHDVPARELAAVEEAFLTSSTRDVQPIGAVDGHQLPAAPGAVTQRARETFAQYSAADLDP